ncbi:MAG: recombination protein RecR [Alphaproteobacteria bacterium]|nr:recombination protein RecR [Alphaproteobacteria bacterium]
MRSASAGPEIERLITLLAKLPGLGPRSARRAALHLLGRRDALMRPLAQALGEAADKIAECSVCGNLDVSDPCSVCTAPNRAENAICVVETVGDLWALERAGAFRGRYHVLGGVLSALDGVRPEDLNISKLIERARADAVEEIVLALNATVDGQTTAHYLADRLEGCGVSVTSLARGVPVGGELDYLDDGTLAAAFKSRSNV